MSTEPAWREAPAAPPQLGKGAVKAAIRVRADGASLLQLSLSAAVQEEALGGSLVGEAVGILCATTGKGGVLIAIDVDGETHDVAGGARGAATIAIGIFDPVGRNAAKAAGCRVLETIPGERLVVALPDTLLKGSQA